MLDIGWTELLIIGVVALVVVGPKDLPKMFRALGEFTGKARAMAREFQRAMESAADEAGVKDVARDLRDTASGRKLREASGLDEMERDFRDIERDLRFDEKGGKPAGGKAGTRPAAAAAGADTQGDDGGEFDEEGADDLIAAEHDADMARKAGGSAREAQRRKRAESAAEARRKAADIRARRDEDEGDAAKTAPGVSGNAPAPRKPAATGGGLKADPGDSAAGDKPATPRGAAGKDSAGGARPATGKAAARDDGNSARASAGKRSQAAGKQKAPASKRARAAAADTSARAKAKKSPGDKSPATDGDPPRGG